MRCQASLATVALLGTWTEAVVDSVCGLFRVGERGRNVIMTKPSSFNVHEEGWMGLRACGRLQEPEALIGSHRAG